MAKAPNAKKINIPSSKVNIALAAGATAAAMKDAGATAGKLHLVPIGKVEVIPGFNVRVDSPAYRDRIEALALDMAANGFKENKPLSGYVAKTDAGNVIYVTDGHTRLAAANRANEIVAADAEAGTAISKLPVIVRAEAPSLTELTIALHTDNNGEPLSPFELGVAVKRLLKEDGADKATIAKRLGVTSRYLDDVLLLVNSPKEVRTAVLEGNVSSTLAISELRKAGTEPTKAVERITAAVDKAKAAGKGKATAKDIGVKMQKVRSTVSIATGTSMKEIVKAVAAYVREAIAVTGEGDEKAASVDGTINLVIEVPAPADPIKAAAAETPTKAAADAAKKSSDKAAAKGATPAKKRGTKKSTEEKPASTPADDEEAITAEDGADDLGIEGAEPVVDRTDVDNDLPSPPNVKTGDNAVDGDEVDI